MRRNRRRLALWQRGNIGWQFGPFCLLAYRLGSLNCHPMEAEGKQCAANARGQCFQGAGREKTLRLQELDLRAVRSARDSGGFSNQCTNLRASLQGAANHCAQLDRLLSGRSYRWSFIDKKFNGPFVDAAVPGTFGAPTVPQSAIALLTSVRPDSCRWPSRLQSSICDELGRRR